jgi:hypothetical protein
MDKHTTNQPNKQTKTKGRLYVYLLLLWKENGLKGENEVIDDKLENQDIKE